MPDLPNRRPQYLVKVHYAEPARGYELTLFCGCGIHPQSGQVVEVFVRPGRVHDGDRVDARDGMMERLCDDLGRLVSFHLQMGVIPEALRDRLQSHNSAGPGRVWCNDEAGKGEPIGVSSPIGAVIEACCVASADFRELARQGDLGFARA
jgi:hypothetical protein